jgi:predicted KAP-like P-loop ATPase
MTQLTEARALRLSADRAIESAEEDLLAREPFARAVADALMGWAGHESLVVGISGPWGAGKSSVKNMMREHLAKAEAGRRPDVLEFSPWQWSGSDQLAAGFFREVGLALGKKDRHQRNTRLASLWANYAAVLKAGALIARSIESLARYAWIALAILIAAGVFAEPAWLRGTVGVLAAIALIAGLMLEKGGQTVQAIATVFTTRAAATARSLGELKAELSNELSRRDRVLVVIVDDVERLTAHEIPLLFQLVKANANFPNVVYLLLFQQELVEKALEKVAPGGDGRAYLEKIIQVPFALPPAEQSRLDKVLFAGLDSTFDKFVEARFDPNRWGNAYLGALRSYFRTPRDVRRFLNTLAFHASVFRGAGSFEVDPVDLICIETLRNFEPALYGAIARSKELLTEEAEEWIYGKEAEEETRRAVVALVDLVPEERRKGIRELLPQLFPSVGWTLGSVRSRVDDAWFRASRVGHPDVFDRYFLLGTPEGDLSEAELQHLVKLAGDRKGFRGALEGLRSRGLLEVALDRLDSYKQEIPTTKAVSLATALFDIGDDLTHEPWGRYMISPAAYVSRIVSWNLRQEPDLQERRRLLERAIRETGGLHLAVRQVAADETEEGKPRQPDKQVLDDEGWKAMRNLCVARLEAAAADGSLASQPNIGYLLYRWRDWAGPEAPAAFVRQLSQSPGGATRFLEGLTHRVTSIGVGAHIPAVTHQIRLREVEDFIPAEELNTHLPSELDSKLLSESQQQALAAFRAAMDGRDTSEENEVP